MKPMLAAQCEDIDALRYPLYATPKLDGIRCLMLDGEATSRSLKPIPNAYIRAKLRGLPPLDGELMVGESFQACTSGIMSEDGEPEFTYYVFDYVGAGNYLVRLRLAQAVQRSLGGAPHVKFLYPVKINNREELNIYSEQCLKKGYEGVMVRSADSPYKHGRATFREGFLIKIKPMEDAEATIVGFEEQMHNANEATTNALGRTERSSHKANLVPKGTLGALVVEHPKFGRFNIGTGFDDALKAKIWANRQQFLGKIVTFKYQAIGTKDKPRIPVFKGFRDARDLS